MRTTNASKRAAAIALISLFVFSCVPRVHARRHRRHEGSRQSAYLSQNSLTAAGDFDADVRQDRITLQSSGYDKTVKIRFANARKSELNFTARTVEAGRLVAGDIDRDGDVDLVWVTTAGPRNAVVLINDGEGNFVEASDASAYAYELDELFSTNDPSGNFKIKRGRRSSSLASASFHDVGLAVLTAFQSTAISSAQVATREPLKLASSFASYLRKRGPPVFLS